MTKADQLFERGAAFLEQLSRKAASEGGFVAKVAEPLAEDADFLRKLKPTLVMARLPSPSPPPPPNPEPTREKKAKKKSGGGPNPILIGVAAFAVGVVVAKLIDWRGHAHPRF